MLDLVHLKVDRTDASIYQQLFMEIRDRYHDYIPVYTDGSRDGNAVACATVFPPNTVISMRLPDSASVFPFQPVLHDWCNKGRVMCYPVCGTVHNKITLAANRKE